jgi:hypothetical protein
LAYISQHKGFTGKYKLSLFSNFCQKHPITKTESKHKSHQI